MLTTQAHHSPAPELDKLMKLSQLFGVSLDELVTGQSPEASTGGAPMNILLAGGAGYIGSHTAVSLLDAGHFHTEDIVLEPLCQSLGEAFPQVEFTVFHPAAIQSI